MNLCIKDLYLLFLTIIIFYLLYCNICSKTKEGFDATSDMKAVINQVYNADIEAIRNLSSIATQLQAGGITVPGNLIASDTLGVSNDRPEGGRISIRNPKKNGKGQTNDWSIWNMTGAYGDKLSFWRYNGDGENAGPALDLFDNGTVNVNGGITTGGITSNDWFRVKGQNGLFFQDFGGGWHMVDTTWVRSYNGKSVYCNQEIRGNRISTEANIVADGTITQKTVKFQQRLSVDKNKSYVITHNLGLPVWLFTIKIIYSDGTGSYDITGQLTNSGYSHSYGIKLLDNNRFILFTGTGAVAVVRNANTVGLFDRPDGIAPASGTYDIYII
jgi:hypothetical protein